MGGNVPYEHSCQFSPNVLSRPSFRGNRACCIDCTLRPHLIIHLEVEEEDGAPLTLEHLLRLAYDHRDQPAPTSSSAFLLGVEILSFDATT